MEFRKITIECANFLAGYLLSSNKEVYERYMKELERWNPSENKMTKNNDEDDED
ncbi:MAG: hypothetical protein ACFFG0_07885 [Candidatus Thorarchaeota archaeon]